MSTAIGSPHETSPAAGARPVLFVDVDGVLNPFMAGETARASGFREWFVRDEKGQQFTMFLNAEHGEWLRGMQDVFELVWATTWQHDANKDIRLHTGLPVLPVAEFDWAEDGPSKVPGLLRYARQRPFVWLDDNVTGLDERLLAASGSDCLVIDVDPHSGLQRKHLARARAWVAGITADADAPAAASQVS